jgi:hypothetical protein
MTVGGGLVKGGEPKTWKVRLAPVAAFTLTTNEPLAFPPQASLTFVMVTPGAANASTTEKSSTAQVRRIVLVKILMRRFS